ncbi:polysaccharide biosynthesis/export family protein [Campylobacter troglodytis]|uniref:polysaccharide biosynthesis/export family protein n=1 Tax=Campylobacter troglodytis TaxID=654363 RepID=UPI001157FDFA|nr:polysaccharide biosynthesis/export family protein [Campylobacter troglodytis]TQR60206.1 sugar ABC transporter substrate-binding protein [Campylobacter troglodytis]
MKKIILFFLPLFILAVDVSELTSSTATNETSTDNNTSLSKVQSSAVFGAHLFSGNFKQSSQHIYNPNYKIAVGDMISVKIWGAVQFESNLIVDSQGNIFIPQVGAIQILGVRNADLLEVIRADLAKIYKDNVFVYADMNAYQNVSVFVTGNVNSPGLYQGLSSDSVIQYIDKANGINLEYGSFRDIKILRENKPLYDLDLYEFLLSGKISLFAFKTGDVILVGDVKKYAFASGDVQKPFRFELKDDILSLQDLAKIAGARAIVTNAIVKSYSANNNLHINAYAKKDFETVMLQTGDEVEFRPDYNAQNLSIRIEGEHSGLHALVVKKGTNLAEVVARIRANAHSDLDSIQVFRKSVALTQKKLIEAQLKELETLALTAPSVNAEGAAIRSNQARTILEFIERAKQVEPKGQIVIDSPNAYKNIILEEDDLIVVPSKNNLVLVQGEVALPGAFVFVDKKKMGYYIDLAGDFSDRADKSRVLVIRASGKAEKYRVSFIGSMARIRPGDNILVLPRIDSQNLQITAMLTQILYQIAIATNVVLNINRN